MLRNSFFAFAFLLAMTVSSRTDSLVDYYYGKLKLTDGQLDSLCQIVISNQESDYLVALAHFQQGLLFRKSHKNLEAYESYQSAYERLLVANIKDEYLHFSILRNQGVILKQHGLIDDAISKYEGALPFAYKYSIKSGLSVKYNLGMALSLKEPELALRAFLESVDEAEEHDLLDRQSKVFSEIAFMFIKSGEYDGAVEYLEKALETAQNDRSKSIALQNFSHMYYEMEAYDLQEQWLKKSLSARQGNDRFISLMDLGECYLNQGSIEKAKPILKEAERYYDAQYLSKDHIKLYEWLRIAFPKEDIYLEKLAYEYKKLAEANENLSNLLEQQAMQQLVLKLRLEEQSERQVSLYKVLAMSGGGLVVLLLLTWRLWWFRLRRKLASGIQEIIDKWDQD